MPEGDTVHRTARAQHAALAGSVLEGSDFRVPRFATLDLTGQTVEEVVAIGKHLFHRVGGSSIHSHLTMDGAWRLFPRDDGSDASPARARTTRWDRPGATARAILTTSRTRSVGFALGMLEVLPRAAESAAWAHLGPDLLDPAWGPALAAEAEARLASAGRSAVFTAVLDQRHLAGIGNVYANELCFLRGVAPTRPVGETDAAALVDLARRLLVANVERPTRSTTGELRRGRTTWVYGRAGQPCRRCGTRILRGRLGPEVASGEPPRDREVAWCPSCQR